MDIAITAFASPAQLSIEDAVPTLDPVDAGAASRFSQLMPPPDTEASTDEVSSVQGVAESNPELQDKHHKRRADGEDARPQSLGDKILGGLESYSTDMKESWDKLGRSMKKDMKMQDYMAVNIEMGKVMIQFELLGKGVNLVQKGADQMVKLQ